MSKLLMTLMLGACCSAGAAEVVAFWPFGTNGLYDVSGNNHTLTASENVAVGDAVTLNGAQTYFNTVDSLNLSSYNAVTIEFWTRLEPGYAPSGVAMFLEQSINTGNNPGSFYVDYGEVAGGVVGMWRPSWNGHCGASGGEGIADGNWHHVAFVIEKTRNDVSASRLYIDATNVYTRCGLSAGNSPGPGALADQKLYIGSRANNEFKIKGEIDNLKISAGALDPSEFVRLDGTVAEPPRIAYWPFGAAGTADMSGNGHALFAAGAGLTFANGAVQLDGTAAQLGTRLPIDLAAYKNGLTAECWMRLPANAPSSTMMLIEHTTDSSGTVAGSFYIDMNEGNAYLRSTVREETGGNDVHTDVNTTTPLNDAAWHHVALVIDPSGTGTNNVRLYLDRELQSQYVSQCASNITQLANGHFYIGSRADSKYRFVGEIDDVRLTPIALRPDQFMSARTDDADPVLGHWIFARGAECAAERGAGPALTAQGATFRNGVAVLGGASSLVTSATLPFAAASGLTFECAYRTEGTDAVPLDALVRPGATRLAGTVPGTEGVWRNVAVVLTGTSVTCYLDGEAVPELAATLESALADGALTLGDGFAGELDDVRVTGAALAPAALLKGHTDDTPITVADWKFSSMDGLQDETGRYPLKSAQSDVRSITYEQARRILLGRGLVTHLPVALSYFPAFTVECVFRSSSSLGGNLLELTGNYNNVPGGFVLSARMFDGTKQAGAGFRTANGFNIRATTGAPDCLLDGAWHRMAFVVDRSSGTIATKLYCDGAEQPTAQNYTSTAATAFVNDLLTIGSRMDSGLNSDWDKFCSFMGDIDEIRITNAALGPDELIGANVEPGTIPETIADWTFDGDEPLADKSGNGHDLMGTATVGDGTATFEGAQYLKTASTLALSSYPQITVEMLFRSDDPAQGNMLFEHSANYMGNSGSLTCYMNGDGTLDAATRHLCLTSVDGLVNDRRWHHLAVQYDFGMTRGREGLCRYFVDGLEVTSRRKVSEPKPLRLITSPGDYTFFLGSRNANDYFFKGAIGRVRILGGLLAPEHFLPLPEPETTDEDVVAYWPFGGAGSWCMDATEHGHDLVPTNGVTYDSGLGCASFAADHGALRQLNRMPFGAFRSLTVECFAKASGTNSPGILGTANWNSGTTGFNLSIGEKVDDLRTAAAVVTQGGFLAGRNDKGVAMYKYASKIAYDVRPVDDAWHHYALVLNMDEGTKGVMHFYDNYAEVSSVELPLSPYEPTLAFCEIGSTPGSKAADRFVGLLDDVRITAAALTPDRFLQKRTPGAGLVFVVR